MLLTHGQLTLRNATAADSQTLADWWNDGSVMAHAGFPRGLGTTAERIASSLSSDTDDTHRRLMLEYGARPIGEMNYRNMGDRTAQIGIKICDASRQNKGLGRVALSLLITALFGMGYDKIILDTNKNNPRAQHVYASLGFQVTGERRDAWTDQLGAPQSSVDYALTPERFISFL